MIDSVKRIVTVKASDLPPCFDIRVHNVDYPFELEEVGEYLVYMKDLTSGESVYLNPNDLVTILVPDSWDNAALDIELDLMNRGMI